MITGNLLMFRALGFGSRVKFERADEQPTVEGVKKCQSIQMYGDEWRFLAKEEARVWAWVG